MKGASNVCIYKRNSGRNTPQKVVLEVGGIGYEIMVPESIIPKLPEIGSQLKLYTYFNVREDIQELYGFNNREEKSILKS